MRKILEHLSSYWTPRCSMRYVLCLFVFVCTYVFLIFFCFCFICVCFSVACVCVCVFQCDVCVCVCVCVYVRACVRQRKTQWGLIALVNYVFPSKLPNWLLTYPPCMRQQVNTEWIVCQGTPAVTYTTPYMDWDLQMSHNKVANNLQVPDMFMAFTQWAWCFRVCFSPAKILAKSVQNVVEVCLH